PVRRVLVVRAAEQAKSVDIVPVGAGEAVDVIDLERAALVAALSPIVDAGAAAAVALVDGALHCIWHVARFRFDPRCRRGARPATSSAISSLVRPAAFARSCS